MPGQSPHPELDALREVLLDDLGRQVRIEVPEPLHPASQRLMDTLGVEVVVTPLVAAREAVDSRNCAQPNCTAEAESRSHFCRHHLRELKDDQPARAVSPRSTREKYWTRERILEALHRWARDHGRPPKSTEWQKSRDGYPTTSSVVDAFGKWSLALKEAGFEPNRSAGTWAARAPAPVEAPVPAPEPAPLAEAVAAVDAPTSAILAELLRRLAAALDDGLLQRLAA